MSEEILRPPLASHRDDRGEIQVLVDGTPMSSVLFIRSKKRAIRANHFHKTDYHFCILTSGKMEYYERPVGSKEPPMRLVIGTRQIFHTPRMVEHEMTCLGDSVLWCFFATIAPKLTTKMTQFV